MKKATSWLLICAAALTAGCDDKPSESRPKEVALTLKAENTAVALIDTDVQRTFTVETAEDAPKEIVINVASDADAAKVSLESETLTIGKGSRSVSSTITFHAEAYPFGADEEVKLSIASEGNTLKTGTVTFYVAKIPLNKATLSTQGTEITVGDTDYEKSITVTLAEKAYTDAVFEVLVESEGGGFEIVTPTITVPKGEQSATGVIKFLKSAYPVELTTGTAVVSISTSSKGFTTENSGTLELRIRGTGTAPMGAVSIGSPIIKVGTADSEVSFTLSISEPLDKPVVFDISATSDKEGCFKLNTPTVTIRRGATTAFGIITFKHEFFKYDTDKAAVTLKISSPDVVVLNSASTLIFDVSGATKNPNP